MGKFYLKIRKKINFKATNKLKLHKMVAQVITLIIPVANKIRKDPKLTRPTPSSLLQIRTLF